MCTFAGTLNYIPTLWSQDKFLILVTFLNVTLLYMVTVHFRDTCDIPQYLACPILECMLKWEDR